jgi:hypothetical protein
MKQLTKESSQEELRAYFALVLDYAKTQDEFPVDLDDVWPIAYDRKDHAVRDLKKEKLFISGIDFTTQKTREVFRQMAENKSEDEFIFPNFGENKPEEETEERMETRGRKEEKYYLTPQCFEFFIARKVRPVFNVYHKSLHAMARRDENFLWAAVAPTSFTLTSQTPANEIAEFIHDMYKLESDGDKYPIYLLEVFAIAYPTLLAAIEALKDLREGFDYTYIKEGDRQGYYLSIEGFNWLISNKAQVVTNAYKIAIERGWYPEKPRFMMLSEEFKPAKMSRRLKSILGVKGTKAERVQSLQNHILSLQGDAESNEELSMLADLLQRTIGYSNFLGEQPMNVE